MTFGSLFSGIGGLDLGLERAGMECRWQVEIDPFCRSVLALHWPEVKRYGDIRKLSGDEMEPVDLICGGFPCQDLSYAGKQAGIEGSRSGLWFEFARLVGELRPGYVLVENVPGLLVYDGIRRVVGELARLGYVGSWLSLRASDFGGAHLRKRVFIVACRVANTGRSTVCGWSRSAEEARTGDKGETEELQRQRGRNPVDAQSANLAHCQNHNGRSGISRAEAATWTDGIGRRGSTISSSALEDAARDEQPGLPGEDWRLWRRGVCEAGEQLADASDGCISEPWRRPEGRDGTGSASEVLSNACDAGLPDAEQAELSGSDWNHEGRAATELCGAFAPGPSDPRWGSILAARPDLAPALEYSKPPRNERNTGTLAAEAGTEESGESQLGRSAFETEHSSSDAAGQRETSQSPLRGVADGLLDWMDRAMKDRTKRLKALGNAVVPQCAEWIGRRILAHVATREP